DPRAVLSWRFQKEVAGFGVLGDIMSHVIDMAILNAGPIRKLISNHETFVKERPIVTTGQGTHFSIGSEGPKGHVTNEDYVNAIVQFENGVHGTFEACRFITGPQCQMAFEVHGTEGAIGWDYERRKEVRGFSHEKDGTHNGYCRVLSGPQ